MCVFSLTSFHQCPGPSEQTGIVVLSYKCVTSSYHLINLPTGPSEQTNIVRSADGIAETQTFPAGASSIFFDFALTDDDFLGEDVETYIASLEIVGDSIIELGSQATTQVLVLDNDGILPLVNLY